MEIKEVAYSEVAKEAVEQLSKGAFLNVKRDDEINTMTIAWGMVGFIWKRPVFQVLVRESRHTYEMIENSECFTVSLPTEGNLTKELAYCGSKSGRDTNKFEDCDLTPIDGINVDCPVIKECKLHFECKIVAKQRLDKNDLFHDFDELYYAKGNYHTMYYGEIVKCYMI